MDTSLLRSFRRCCTPHLWTSCSHSLLICTHYSSMWISVNQITTRYKADYWEIRGPVCDTCLVYTGVESYQDWAPLQQCLCLAGSATPNELDAADGQL